MGLSHGGQSALSEGRHSSPSSPITSLGPGPSAQTRDEQPGRVPCAPGRRRSAVAGRRNPLKPGSQGARSEGAVYSKAQGRSMILTPLSTENPNDHAEQVWAAPGQRQPCALLPRGGGGTTPPTAAATSRLARRGPVPYTPAHLTEEDTESRWRWTGRGLRRVPCDLSLPPAVSQQPAVSDSGPASEQASS